MASKLPSKHRKIDPKHKTSDTANSSDENRPFTLQSTKSLVAEVEKLL
jgi:hypothetical protein